MNDEHEGYAPGTFGCHEALDRTSLLAELVDNLAQHPAIQINAAWQRKAERAAEHLADLYQLIGSVHLVALPPTSGERTELPLESPGLNQK